MYVPRLLVPLCVASFALCVETWSQTVTPALPSDPAALMALAHEKNGLTGPGVQPWHIRGTYKVFGEKGKPEYEGIYEEWWISPTKYKLSYSDPKLKQTDYATGAELLREGTQDWPAGPQMFLRTMLIDPLPDDGLLKDFSLKTHSYAVGPVKLECVSITYRTSGLHLSQNDFPAACFDSKLPILRMYSEGSGWLRTVSDDLVTFQGHYLARTIQVFVSGKLQSELKVEQVESLKDQPDTVIAAPKDAQPVNLAEINLPAAAAAHFLIKKAFPEYPMLAKEQRVQGKVDIEAVIEDDGRLDKLQVLDGPSALREAALDAVKQWVYRPMGVMGQTRPVKTVVHVIFSLG